MNEDFASNLRLLCSYYKSIAEVCRRLNINRPQFNRYLSGRHRPSANTLLKFCDFFGVDEHEILLPHSQFEQLIRLRPKSSGTESVPSVEGPHMERLGHLTGRSLDKYLGFYFEIFYSMACPGKILRTLVYMERQGDQIVYRRTERLQEYLGSMCHGVYFGVAQFLVDRIFMVDYESLTGNEVSQTILFPTFKNRVSRLSGLKLGASGTGERMPSCVRVVYEYLGTSINVRQALKLCGLYERDTTEIDEGVKRAIVNQMDPGEWHFRGRYLS